MLSLFGPIPERTLRAYGESEHCRRDGATVSCSSSTLCSFTPCSSAVATGPGPSPSWRD